MKTIEDVENFWQKNPLFIGESKFDVGSEAFFQEHQNVYLRDCFAGDFSKKKSIIPKHLNRESKVLDLGCGIGFWTEALLRIGNFKNIYAADLTTKALELTEKRLAFHKLTANLSLQNAEKMTYKDQFFSHVNCQGVIHHTPNPHLAIKEIARVLKDDGTANLSVYYKNFILKNWSKISFLGKILYRTGARLKGRGREEIFLQNNPEEIVRLYDGDANPIGKAYTKKEIIAMINPYFSVEKVFLYFFPLRALSFNLPNFLHRFLSHRLGFMIHLSLKRRKECAA